MKNDKITSIHIGEFFVTGEPSTLVVHGLGSCVALILFDEEMSLGGLAHVLLPGPRPESDAMSDMPAKYGDEALNRMIEAFMEKGGKKQSLRAALIGGARLFSAEQEVDNEVGPRNVRAMRFFIKEKGIPVMAEEVGGKVGRSVYFTLPSCRLEVKTLREGKREIAFSSGAGG